MACAMTNLSYDYCIAGLEFNNPFTQTTPLGVEMWVLFVPVLLAIILWCLFLNKMGFFDDSIEQERET